MKKIAILAILLGGFSSSIAQKVTVGLKIGQGITHIQQTESQDWFINELQSKEENISIPNQIDSSYSFLYTERNGFSGGLYFNIKLGQSFSFQPEVMFSGKGFNIDTKISRTDDISIYRLDFTETYRYNYLEVPLLARFNTTMGNLKPYIIAGPVLSFNLSSRVLHKQNVYLEGNADFDAQLEANGFQTDGDDIRFINGVRGFDFGVVGGLGFDYEFSDKFTFKLEARYASGFLNSHVDDYPAPGLEMKHKGVFIFAGIGFRIPKAKESTIEEAIPSGDNF